MTERRVRFAEYEVDFDLCELRKRGARLPLQRKPFRVLELLLRRPGELVTREELIHYLWPDSHVSFARGLNTAVNSLRHALGESSRKSRFIETRPGIGYRFIAPVEEFSNAHSSGVRRHVSVKDSDAYQDCLRGRYLLDKKSEEEIYKAIAYFKSAAADERQCALANAGIAEAYCELVCAGSVVSSNVALKARSAAQLALERDPELSAAHVSDGLVKMVFDWHCEAARQAFDRAFAADPSSLAAHRGSASLMRALGDYQEASEACRLALVLDPLSLPLNLEFAACLYAARDFQSVVSQCWKILSLASSSAPAQILLAAAYQQLGMYEDAMVEFQNAKRCAAFEPAAIGGLGQLFGAMGSEAEAEQSFAELSAHAQNRYISDYWFALICAGRKHNDLALSFLERSLLAHDPALLWLRADARFDGICDDEALKRCLDFRSKVDS